MLPLCELTVEAARTLLDYSVPPGSAREGPESCVSWGLPRDISGLRSWEAPDLMALAGDSVLVMFCIIVKPLVGHLFTEGLGKAADNKQVWLKSETPAESCCMCVRMYFNWKQGHIIFRL